MITTVLYRVVLVKKLLQTTCLISNSILLGQNSSSFTKRNGEQKFCSTLQVSSNTSAEYIVGITKQPHNAETPDKRNTRSKPIVPIAVGLVSKVISHRWSLLLPITAIKVNHLDHRWQIVRVLLMEPQLHNMIPHHHGTWWQCKMSKISYGMSAKAPDSHTKFKCECIILQQIIQFKTAAVAKPLQSSWKSTIRRNEYIPR